MQRHVNLCSFSYWQHDLFAKIDHRCILFSRPLHRSVASDLMLLSMKCCTQMIFLDSLWRSVSLAFSWTFFLRRSGFFLNFLNNSLSYFDTASSPIQKSRTTTESGQGQDSPHIVVVRYLYLLVFIYHLLATCFFSFCYSFLFFSRYLFSLLLFFYFFFQVLVFSFSFFGLTTTIDFYLDTTITKHHHHQYKSSKDHQRKKGSQQRRKAPITTPNVTNALCSFRADWGGNYQRYGKFYCLLFFLYNTIKTHFSPWRVQSLFLLYAWQSQMGI